MNKHLKKWQWTIFWWMFLFILVYNIEKIIKLFNILNFSWNQFFFVLQKPSFVQPVVFHTITYYSFNWEDLSLQLKIIINNLLLSKRVKWLKTSCSKLSTGFSFQLKWVIFWNMTKSLRFDQFCEKIFFFSKKSK